MDKHEELEVNKLRVDLDEGLENINQIPCMSHMRCIIHSWSTTVPKHSSPILWNENILVDKNKCLLK